MGNPFSEIDESSYDAEKLLNPVTDREVVDQQPRRPVSEVDTVSEPVQESRREEPRREDSGRSQEPKREPSAGSAESERRSSSYFPSDERIDGRAALAKVKMFSGIVLFFLAAYTLIVTISYFANISHDQSALLGGVIEPSEFTNAGGLVGAWMSHYLLYEWLGVGGFILIYFMGAVSLRLLNVIRFNFWGFTFKCLLTTVAISIISGFIMEAFDVHSSFYWGGRHGWLVNERITQLAGFWGALALSAIMTGLLVVMFIDTLGKIYRFIDGKIVALIERRRRERAEYERRLAEKEEAQRRAEAAEAAEKKEAQRRAEVAEREKAARESAESRQDESADQPQTHQPQPIQPVVAADEPVVSSDDSDNPVNVPDTSGETFNESGQSLFGNSADEPVAAAGDDMPLFVDETDSVDEIDSDFGDEPLRPDDEDAEAEDTEDDETEMVVETPVIEPCDSFMPSDFYDPTAELSRFVFPSLDLLNDVAYSTDSVDASEMEENKVRITKTLSDYGIPISHIHATVGPTVTLYEIIPAEGVRIAKIKRLEDDIAMSLAALGIRIIAPIPGKGTIGIEVPNKDPQVVSIRSILSSKKFQESHMELPMALGCTISNDVFMADLCKMPHLLVAGATGMGKSVGLNTIIASLLYKKHPAQLKFVLIDPKMVEFSLYATLENHYLAKLPGDDDAIITDPSKVVATLNSLCIEMDNRYGLLKTASCRNIKEYNDRFVRRNLNPEKGHHYMPYIVVVVDEFADLIMTAGKEVETPIARIAQKARAVGIHMILATQRPSTNVITGVIKANFPGRIAFRVFQMVDSRTILDRPGANQLIGRGDMLFSNNGKIERVQCAFIDTPEVEAICEAIGSQPGYGCPYPLPEYIPENDGNATLSGNPCDRDPLFGDAARYVVQTDTASTSSLQRRYSIGYNRAGKIMDQLEAAGIVGPAQGGKPRQVLMDTIQLDRYLGAE